MPALNRRPRVPARTSPAPRAGVGIASQPGHRPGRQRSSPPPITRPHCGTRRFAAPERSRCALLPPEPSKICPPDQPSRRLPSQPSQPPGGAAMTTAAYFRAWRAAHPEYRARQNRLRNERRRRLGRGDRSGEYAARRSRAIPPMPGLHLGHRAVRASPAGRRTAQDHARRTWKTRCTTTSSPRRRSPCSRAATRRTRCVPTGRRSGRSVGSRARSSSRRPDEAQ